MARATIRSVATETGLSLATVSRALKGSPAVRPETIKLVSAAAARLGYQRSAIAANLRTGKTGTLSLVMPIERPGDMIGDVGALQFMVGACNRLTDSDYTLTLVPYDFSEPSIDAVARLVKQGVCDGLIFSLTEPDDPRVHLLHAEGVPFVSFGRTEGTAPHAFFDFDDEDFARRAATLLIERGCRRLVLMLQPGPALYNGHRRDGFAQAIASGACRGEIVWQNDLATVRKLVRSGEPPDGIVCDSEISTLAMLTLLQGEGLQIGRDIHLVTLETSALPDLFSSPIPGFFQDLHRAGWVCADFLLKRLGGIGPQELQRVETMALRDRSPGGGRHAHL